MASKQHHIMMFPWLAFGHMIPFLELSKRLAAKGSLISYVSTPKNLQRLPPIPSNLQSKINFVEIPLPQVEGLPENCEATIDLQLNQIQFLKKAYDRLAQPFEILVQKSVPDLILFDFVPYWIPEIGAKFGVPTVFFSVYTAAAMAFIGPPEELKTGNRRPSPEHFTMPPDWIPFPSLIATRPDYATRMWTSLNIPDASGVSSGHRLAKSIEDCSFVAFRSCDEFEGEYISVVRELYQKPVLPIGLLPPVPFVWILRKPQEVHCLDLLPPGFANRTQRQGIVIQGWVPQLEILAHSAIGGCLFHSGWGTIVESLGFGHPLILLPMITDQGFNAKRSKVQTEKLLKRSRCPISIPSRSSALHSVSSPIPQNSILQPQSIEEHQEMIFRCPINKANWPSFDVLFSIQYNKFTINPTRILKSRLSQSSLSLVSSNHPKFFRDYPFMWKLISFPNFCTECYLNTTRSFAFGIRKEQSERDIQICFKTENGSTLVLQSEEE